MAYPHFAGKNFRKQDRRKRRKVKKARAHVNKYAYLAPRKGYVYSAEDKRVRYLPLAGRPGEMKQAGLIVLFHGRRYRLVEDVTIPETSPVLCRFEMF